MAIQRITKSLLTILQCLLDADERGEPVYGRRIMEITGVVGPTVYSTLTRLLRDEWVTARRESVNEDSSRPPRRYYRLTDSGRDNAHALLSIQRSRRPLLRAEEGGPK